jgi:hypothetical protein
MVLADHSAFHAIVAQKLTYLICIPGGHEDFIAPALELFDDGSEERDMGRIIQIHPDLLLLS